MARRHPYAQKASGVYSRIVHRPARHRWLYRHRDRSLQKLYANVFGQKISKRQRLTNWEIDVLNDKQKQYAATDAWSCINLYEEIERLRKTGDYNLVVSEEEREKSEE